MCPIGCELQVIVLDEKVEVAGHKCEKGKEFASEEVLHPKRNLATSVPIHGIHHQMLSVRLDQRFPRDKIFLILNEITKLRPVPPVFQGQVLIENILDTGSNVIATRTVK
jgi:CxxC motif-containing protein